MSASEWPQLPHPRSTILRACPERSRRDGWTAERQIGFLAALECSRSVSKAAKAVGMSRESAYRLRDRPAGALFAAVAPASPYSWTLIGICCSSGI
jgi:hypothetical protein